MRLLGHVADQMLLGDVNGAQEMLALAKEPMYFSSKLLRRNRIRMIKGVHYFDAHRLEPQLLEAPELQVNPRAENISGPEGADEAVDDPESEDEASLIGDDDGAVVSPDDDQPGAPPYQTEWRTRRRRNWPELLKSLTLVEQLQTQTHP